MVYLHELQRITLNQADNLINEGKTFNEILHHFFESGYTLKAPHGASGQPLKSKVLLFFDGVYSFVDIKKKRNGGAIWETIKIS